MILINELLEQTEKQELEHEFFERQLKDIFKEETLLNDKNQTSFREFKRVVQDANFLQLAALLEGIIPDNQTSWYTALLGVALYQSKLKLFTESF